MAVVNVNGRIADEAHAVISVFDHGFLFGEGIYETLRTYNGEPFLFDRHMRRLRRSAGMLHLPLTLSDQQIGGRFEETMRAAGAPKEYLTARQPLVNLIDALSRRNDYRQIVIQKGATVISLQKGTSA